MVSPSMRLRWYKRKDVQEAIVESAENKEIAVKFGDKGFGKRPDTIKRPKDVLEFAKQGATSFHCSEELWSNPLNIVTGMRKKEVNELRIGWDLILDLDCVALELSQITAHVLIDALKYYGIKNFSIKFSGNHGFHIGVPFWTFPKIVKDIPVKNLFPEGPRKIAAFLQDRSRSVLAEKMLEFYSLNSISKKINVPLSKLIKNNVFDPYLVVDIDTILIAPRHLYRMPYSFNEKSGLVSIPVEPKDVLYFDKNCAKFENVVPTLKFFDKTNANIGEAKHLFIEAFDSACEEEKKKIEIDDFKTKFQKKEFEVISEAIPEICFPPCIKKILKGLVDGKKRSVFILMNFLSSIGWSHEDIKKLLLDWNKNNEEPLRESILYGQLNNKKNKTAILPPNCKNASYMSGMGVCCPDNLCKFIKNPVNYAICRFNFIKKEKIKTQKKN